MGANDRESPPGDPLREDADAGDRQSEEEREQLDLGREAPAVSRFGIEAGGTLEGLRATRTLRGARALAGAVGAPPLSDREVVFAKPVRRSRQRLLERRTRLDTPLG